MSATPPGEIRRHRLFSGQEILPLALLALVWIVALSHYPRLPDILPSAFRFGGLPSEWGPKGRDFFALPVTAGVVYLALTLVRWTAVRRPIVAGRVLRGRAAREMGRALHRFLYLMKGALLAFLLNVEFRTLQVAYGSRDGLGWDSYVAAGLLLLYAALGSVLLARAGRRWLRRQDADAAAEAEASPA